MSVFDRYFHGPHAAARAYLLARILPALLALDIWMLMIGHAGRYGAAGFNVAHFTWLDRLLPLPTPGSYIGLLLVTGLLALYVAIAGPRWPVTLVLGGLYTLSWSISMLDSYQHHYFLSLVLVCLCAFPVVSRRDLFHHRDTNRAVTRNRVDAGADGRDHVSGAADQTTGANGSGTGVPTATGFGYPLLACTIAIVYTYAAIAKCDPHWLDGYTIRRISKAEALVGPLMGLLGPAQVTSEQLWSWLSISVVPMELALGVGYLVTCQQDRVRGRAMRVVTWAAAGLAFALHAGAEAMSLDIGWFSYYMMLLAAVYMLPATWLTHAARIAASPGGRVESLVSDLEDEMEESSGPLVGFLIAIGVAGLLWLAGANVNLPGAEPACLIAGGALVALAVIEIARGRAAALIRPALTTGLAGALMWLAITQSEVRWDFYRYLGGDLMRRGLAAEALDAYVTGEAYAPRGRSRAAKIEQLKRQLGR